MEEISRKNEKFIGSNRNKLLNREVRGESPIRKASTTLAATSNLLFKNSSTTSTIANCGKYNKRQQQQHKGYRKLIRL